MSESTEFDEVFSSDSLTCLTIWNFEDSKENTDYYGPTSKITSETLTRLGQGNNKNAKEGLIIIFSEGTAECWDNKPYASRLMHSPLRMRQKTFQSIAGAFSLPESHLQMHREGSTVFMDVGNAPDLSSGGIQTFMIQNSFTSTSRFSASFSYDLEKHVTKALVHGLREPEIKNLNKKLIAHRNNIGLPMLLPLLLLTSRVDSATTKVRDCHQEIVEIEHQTGIQTKWHPGMFCCESDEKHASHHRYDGINFDQVTADLTSLTSKLAYVEYLCEVHLPMLDSFDNINQRILQAIPEGSKHRLQQVELRLRVENNFLRSSLKGTYSRAKYLSKRGQAQVHTIYSLIAQKDNALSMKDNAALKTISEDQKRIALAATRDSAAMQVISAITAFFLPATFTATFFSTTFFNFQSGDSSRPVSGWLGLYFLVTIVLSALVLPWWYISTRRKQHEIEGEFGGTLINQQSSDTRSMRDDKGA